MKWSWVQRRWYEFRVGDGTYLRYFVSFLQFIIISYTLYVPNLSGITWMQWIFSSITIYTFTFVIIYAPVAVVVGHIHRHRQMTKETIIAIEQNPVSAHNAVVGMRQAMLWYRKFKIPILPEYMEMFEFWQKIEKGWKPPSNT